MSLLPEGHEIVKIAKDLRLKAADKNAIQPTQVVKVAESLGYHVSEFEPSEKTRAISGAVNHEQKIIFINASEDPARKRFTIAHEIAHILFDAKDGSLIDFRHQVGYRTSDIPREKKANQFAAELLMPRDIFSALWSAYSGNISAVANFLQVSVPAAKIRAEELNLS